MTMQKIKSYEGEAVEVGEPATVVKAWLKLRRAGGQVSVSGVTQAKPSCDSLEVAVPIELHVDPEVFKPKPVPIVIDGGITASPHIVGKQRTQR